MKWMQPVLFVAGLILASLAESTGPFWVLAAGGSFLSFTALLVLSVQAEAGARQHATGERREIAVSLPPPLYLEEMAGATDTAPCPMHPGWISTDAPLPTSAQRQSCRVT